LQALPGVALSPDSLYTSCVRFWWVNQNQTFDQEFSGGYLWSPKRNQNGASNQFYENMREVAPGDVIFSFRDQAIAAIGIAQSYCYECPCPSGKRAYLRRGRGAHSRQVCARG